MSSQDLNSAKSTEPGELSRARRLFKNQNKNQEEMRRRRNVMSVEIRKSKREETVEKRRNIQMAPDGPESDIDSEMENSFQRLWNLSHSRDTMTRFSGIQQIRRALCSNMSPPIGEFIQAGFVKVLVNCLTEDSNPMLQFEAAWALTNISSGTTEQTSSVVDAGIVPHLIRLLERPLKLINMELTEQIIWCIGNIMGNGANSRIFLIANGLADLLTNMVVNSPKALPLACLKQLSWTMVNLTRISTVPNKLTDIAKWIPAYHILIDLEDPTVKSDIVWSLCYICDAGADYCQLLLENGFYPKFLQLLEHDEKKVRTAALRTVGTILSSTDAQTQVLLNLGVLKPLHRLMRISDDGVQKEAGWCVSNICAGTKLQITMLQEAGFFPLIVEHLMLSFRVQKESCYSVINIATNGTRDQLHQLLSLGALGPYCKLLYCEDATLLEVLLDGISEMLRKHDTNDFAIAKMIEECGGLEQIEMLQNHANPEIYHLAYELVEKFFSDDVDPEVVPDQNASTYVFKGGKNHMKYFSF